MSRRRITLKIDSVTVPSGRFSRRELSAAIEAELTALIHQQPAGLQNPLNARIRSLDGGQVKGRGSEAGVGQAVARAALGVLKG
ncbi:hypothetical protein [Pelagibius sp. Alg239-R121]|uniref:hypothetical protein n=1 Tax=Pelagibius sp. Alg239-R121 TaxID=2993448 RepID=UPI0024A6F13C|nr:hypothetical protein [Pelagibius sp. Alg239-R121]